MSGSYQGESKRSLAHSEGNAQGVDSYKGNFKKGYPQGRGTYTWQNGDFYVGSWHKGQRNGEGELITIHFKQNGSTNTTVSNVIVDGDSGTEVTKDNCVCFENFVLPFNCSLRYTTANKMKKTRYEARFDFVITQMGNWDLVLHN